MKLLSFDRLARSVHYRLGRYIDNKDATAKRHSETGSAQPISRTPTRINIGCGYDKLPDYLNVDVEPACAPDLLIVGDDDSMIPRDHFEEVLAKDVLEHIPRPKTLDALLNWADYLVDGGKLRLQTSSILHLAAKLQPPTRYRDQHSWTVCLFGNQAHPGDFHFTGFTDTTLKVHLLAAGFRIDLFELRDEWLFAAEAAKVESWTRLLDVEIASDAEFLQEGYRRALFRDIRDDELGNFTYALNNGIPRKQVLKSIYASTERLFCIAERNNF